MGYETLTERQILTIRDAKPFAGLPSAVFWDLIAAFQVRQLAARQVLFRQGDPGDALYVIQAGAVAVTVSAHGRTLRRGVLRAGDAFGEISALDGGPRTATATAETDAILLRLTGADFWEVFDEHAPAARGPLLALCAMARKIARAEEDLLRDTSSRLAALLLALADQAGLVRSTQIEMAEMLGTHRSVVVRLLAGFRASGLVTTTAGRIRVVDRAGLAREK